MFDLMSLAAEPPSWKHPLTARMFNAQKPQNEVTSSEGHNIFGESKNSQKDFVRMEYHQEISK